MGVSRTKVRADVQKLIEQRDRLLVEIEALKNKVAGIELAISLIEGESPQSAPEQGRRQNVKTILIDLLKETGTTGLNAQSAVEIAIRRGVTLDRGSVSSTLSRMKAEGIVNHDGQRYRLPEFSRPPMTVVQGGATGS